MYGWIDDMYASQTRVWVSFFSQNHGFSGLTPVSSDTTTLSKSYFELGLKIVSEFLRKRLFFKSQTVTAPGY